MSWRLDPQARPEGGSEAQADGQPEGNAEGVQRPMRVGKLGLKAEPEGRPEGVSRKAGRKVEPEDGPKA